MVMGLSLPEGSTGHASYQKYRACSAASGKSGFRVCLPGHRLRLWEYPADRPGHAVGPHLEPGGHLRQGKTSRDHIGQHLVTMRGQTPRAA